MNSTRFGSIAAVAIIGSLALASCAGNETPTGSGTPTDGGTLSGEISGSGASSQEAAQGAWASEFQIANPDVTVNYTATGSGTGREQFSAGAVDFAASDEAYSIEEVTAGGFGACAADSTIIEVPAYISPIAVAFNLPGIDSLNMDPATVAGIFAGEITSWDDPAIAALNDGVDLPATTISAVHRSDDSGTTENFTDYLYQTAGDVWTNEPDGVWPLDSGEAAEGTSGVAAALESENTIGYIDASRAEGFGTVAIQVGDQFVPYSPEAAAAAVDASELEEGRAEGDLAYVINRTTDDPTAYPIVLVSYLIACTDYEDDTVAELVKGYYSYATSPEGQQVAADAAGSAPLSSAISEQVTAALEMIG